MMERTIVTEGIDRMRRPFTTPFSTVLVLLALLAVLPAISASASGHKEKHVRRAGCAAIGAPTVEVLHGPVTITLANPDSDGHQVGDLRATSIATTDAAGAPLGRLDATLTTTAIDAPAAGDEVRISTLVFVFGEDGRDQIVVGGSAVYPAQGATLAEGSVTTRPIQGGSGRFMGALGSAVSEHLADGSWRHTLHLSGPSAVRRLVAIPRIGGDELDRARSDRVHDASDRVFGDVDPSRLRGVLRALWSHFGDLEPSVERGVMRRLERERSHRQERMRPHAPVACLAPAPSPAQLPAYEGLRGAPITEPGITRVDLGRTLPAGAPGQELGLWHYTIPVGQRLPPHTHPGAQIARVIRGALSYTVISGEGAIIASDGTSTAIGPGTYVLNAGDSVVENPGMEHYGSNPGPEVVELIAATLYTEGAPLSIPVETAAPAESPMAATASPAP